MLTKYLWEYGHKGYIVDISNRESLTQPVVYEGFHVKMFNPMTEKTSEQYVSYEYLSKFVYSKDDFYKKLFKKLKQEVDMV